MPGPAITLRGISKHYTLGAGAGYRRFTEVFADLFRRGRPAPDHRDLWALRDVTFDVGHGEVVGIIGRNGAGKSTLLKVLSRITAPTSGRAELVGRVGSLLEVGTGFHPELSGRENVFLNGAVLGMRRREIIDRFDEIVEFAEVERFLDTPVKRFSSGMYVRLAFAVAAHLDPEILIVDEVLAVGDAGFQRKCLGKMGDVARSGRTVLFVSHNMGAVRNLCDRGVLLHRGRVGAIGPVEQVVEDYLELAEPEDDRNVAARADREGTGRVRFVKVLFGIRGEPSTGLVCGEDGCLSLEYESTVPAKNVSVSVGFFAPTGEGALFIGNDIAGDVFETIPSNGRFVCSIPNVPLLPGVYSLNLFVTVSGEIADWVRDAVRVTVDDGDFFGSGKLPPPGYGSIAVDHAWAVAGL